MKAGLRENQLFCRFFGGGERRAMGRWPVVPDIAPMEPMVNNWKGAWTRPSG